jgi:hypothetical protein
MSTAFSQLIMCMHVDFCAVHERRLARAQQRAAVLAAARPDFVRKKDIVCMYWLKDRCMKDHQCEYLHLIDEARAPLCMYIDAPQCVDGKRCMFRHYRHPHEMRDTGAVGHGHGDKSCVDPGSAVVDVTVDRTSLQRGGDGEHAPQHGAEHATIECGIVQVTTPYNVFRFPASEVDIAAPSYDLGLVCSK